MQTANSNCLSIIQPFHTLSFAAYNRDRLLQSKMNYWVPSSRRVHRCSLVPNYARPTPSSSHNGHDYFDSDNTLSTSMGYDFTNEVSCPKALVNFPGSLNRLQSPRTEISSCLILSKLSRTCCSFHRVCRNQSSHAYIAGAWRQSPRIRTSIHFYRYNNIVVFWNTWSRFLHCQWLINLLVIVILSKDKETVE